MPVFIAKPTMKASVREWQWRSWGQPSTGCQGSALLSADMGWVLPHKSWVLFCIGPSLSAVSVLTAPPSLGQCLPCSVLSKEPPLVRLVVHRNTLLVSSLLLSCLCMWGASERRCVALHILPLAVSARVETPLGRAWCRKGMIAPAGIF